MWCRATATPTGAADLSADVPVLYQPHNVLERAISEYCDAFNQDAVMPAYLTALGVALRPSLIVPFSPICPTVYVGHGSA